MILSHYIAVSAGVTILLPRAFTPDSFGVEHGVPGRLLILEAGF